MAITIAYNKTQSTTWTTQIGLGGLYLFSFFAFLGQVGSAVGLFLMLIAITGSFREVRRELSRDPAFWMACAFILYLIVNAYLAANEFPRTATEQWKGARNWGRLVVFLVLAWWMRGDPKRIYWSFLLALLGLFVHLVVSFDLSNIEIALRSGRTGFAYSIMFAGILSGACLIAMLIFTPKILNSRSRPLSKLAIGLLWFAGFAILLQLQITAQSRGAWVATSLGLLLASLVIVRHLDRKKLAIFGVMFSILVLIAMQNSSTVEQRLTKDRATISAFLNGAQMEQIPFQSMGARLHLLHYGLKRWLERPLLGWGPGTEIEKHFSPQDFSEPIDRLQASNLPRFAHLHNGFLTILAQLGIVGAGLFGLLGIFVLRQLMAAYRKKLIPDDLSAATSGILLILLLSNLANSRFAVLDFQFLATLAMSAAYTTRYQRQIDARQRTLTRLSASPAFVNSDKPPLRHNDPHPHTGRPQRQAR